MTPDRWRQVEELFDAARQRPAGERAALLRAADPELRAEVESLLAANDSAGPLERSPFPSAAEAVAFKVGDRLGNFEITGLLGRGGMGEVYRARDTRLGREVAIKTLPPAVAADRDRVARFEREARAASALNHPNIVSVHDVGREGGVSFIVSELVEGETLRAPLPLRKLVEVGTQICDGLAAAHAAGVVHRDLKPGNVMLTREGRVKILDFGLARTERKVGAESTTMEVSHPGLVFGTPGYMSPEQVRGEATDARSDIFSLGVLLYEMASGKRPFGGDSSIEVMNAILKDDPPELPPASPPELDRIIRHCLEKEPGRRFQSAADVGFALGTLERPASSKTAAKKPRWAVWAGALALLCGVGASAYWWGRRGSDAVGVDNLTLRQITWDRGLTADPALSPDGKLLAYASDRGGSDNLDIWVQQVDGSGDPLRLTSDPADDANPNFSPDSTRIAFYSARNGGGIYVVPALGGEETLMVPNGRLPRFSPDGRYLMYYRNGTSERSAGLGGSLSVLTLATGVSTNLSAGCSLVSRAAWSPDSRAVLFMAQCAGKFAYLLTDPEGKQRKATSWEAYFEKYVKASPEVPSPETLWLDRPARLLAWTGFGRNESLWRVPASRDGSSATGEPQRLLFGLGAVTQVSAGGSGRIAVASTVSEESAWGVPIDGSGRPTGQAQQLSTERSQAHPAISTAISPDSRLLLFTTYRDRLEMFARDLPAGRTRRFSSGGYTPVPSKDGAQVAYCNPALYTTPANGGVPQRLADGCAAIWDWSHDGKFLLVDPLEKNGTIDIVATATGKATSMLAAPDLQFWNSHFSPDDRWVTFNATTPGNSRVYIAPFRQGSVLPSEWRPILAADGSADKPRFSVDGRTLFFTSSRDGYRCIWAQPLTADLRAEGEPFAVHHSHQLRLSLGGGVAHGGTEISVSKDMVVFPQTEATGNIWLMEPAKK